MELDNSYICCHNKKFITVSTAKMTQDLYSEESISRKITAEGMIQTLFG